MYGVEQSPLSRIFRTPEYEAKGETRRRGVRLSPHYAVFRDSDAQTRN